MIKSSWTVSDVEPGVRERVDVEEGLHLLPLTAILCLAANVEYSDGSTSDLDLGRFLYIGFGGIFSPWRAGNHAVEMEAMLGVGLFETEPDGGTTDDHLSLTRTEPSPRRSPSATTSDTARRNRSSEQWGYEFVDQEMRTAKLADDGWRRCSDGPYGSPDRSPRQREPTRLRVELAADGPSSAPTELAVSAAVACQFFSESVDQLEGRRRNMEAKSSLVGNGASAPCRLSIT